jgi:hypothetical protein
LTHQVLAIESEATNQSFLRALAGGNEALRRMQAELPLDMARAIMEDAEDALDTQAAIDGAFSQMLGVGGPEAAAATESELLRELDDMTAAAEAVGAVRAARPTAVPAAAAHPAAAAVATPTAAASLSPADFPAAPRGAVPVDATPSEATTSARVAVES